MRAALPHGLWVPVLPGTRQVTIGGAIGADIHGKNHHTKGSFGNHVRSLDLVTADGSVRRLTPDGPDSELFWATVGGMGLTGVVVRATVQLHRTESAYFVVDTDRTADLDELMALLTDGSDDTYGYSAAWFDTTTTGAQLGRAVLTRGSLATVDQLPREAAQRPAEVRRAAAADRSPTCSPAGWPTATRCGRSASSGTARHRSASAARSRTSRPSTRCWTCSGTGTGSTARADSCSTSSWCRSARSRRSAGSSRRSPRSPHASGLNVLKRFGEGNTAPLSFPQPGWTITVDFPIARGLHQLCDELDELVLGAGGRLYLAKESRASAAKHPPRLPAVRRVAQGARRRRPRRESSPPTCPDRLELHVIDAVGNPQSILLLGGTSEIGLAVVEAFATDRPLRVVLAARPSERLDAARARLEARGCAVETIAVRRRRPRHARRRGAQGLRRRRHRRGGRRLRPARRQRAGLDRRVARRASSPRSTTPRPCRSGVALAERMREQGHGSHRGVLVGGRRAGPPVQLRLRLHQGRAGRVLLRPHRGAAPARRHA